MVCVSVKRRFCAFIFQHAIAIANTLALEAAAAAQPLGQGFALTNARPATCTATRVCAGTLRLSLTSPRTAACTANHICTETKVFLSPVQTSYLHCNPLLDRNKSLTRTSSRADLHCKPCLHTDKNFLSMASGLKLDLLDIVIGLFSCPMTVLGLYSLTYTTLLTTKVTCYKPQMVFRTLKSSSSSGTVCAVTFTMQAKETCWT